MEIGDDDHGCVMVDAVGSGHLAVSECRLNIGQAIPHLTIPYWPYHTQGTVPLGIVPLNIGWAHLAEANCPGAPQTGTTLLVNHITLYRCTVDQIRTQFLTVAVVLSP